MEDFHHWFKQEVASIDRTIESIANDKLKEGEKQAMIETCLNGISKLSAEVKDAASSLPVHDLQNYSKAIDSKTKRLQEVRTALAPSRKFAFKKTGSFTPITHLKPAEPTPDIKRLPAIEMQTDELSTSASKSVLQQSSLQQSIPSIGFRLSLLNATHYILASSATEKAPLASLEDIQRSCVDMAIAKSGAKSFATLMVNNIKETLLLCGTILGPTHMTAVTDSTVVIETQQIRIHDCNNIIVYLQCSSRPIIEDCTGVRFAPLPSILESEHNEKKVNMWDQVDDFKWLKAEASPNWSVLKSEDERAIDDESWRQICGQRSSVKDVEVLLKYAKIQ